MGNTSVRKHGIPRRRERAPQAQLRPLLAANAGRLADHDVSVDRGAKGVLDRRALECHARLDVNERLRPSRRADPKSRTVVDRGDALESVDGGRQALLDPLRDAKRKALGATQSFCLESDLDDVLASF